MFFDNMCFPPKLEWFSGITQPPLRLMTFQLIILIALILPEIRAKSEQIKANRSKSEQIGANPKPPERKLSANMLL